MLTIGIDIGTTTICFVVVDSHNKIAESITLPNDSALEALCSWEHLQDPERIYQLVISELESMLKKYPDVSAIGLTGQMHGILYVDGKGEAVSPLYTWQDERGNIIEEGESLVERLKEVTSAPVATGYGLVTHIWNLQHELVPSKAEKICTIADYVGMKLTGRKSPLLHVSNAASLGFFDVQNRCFLIDELASLGVKETVLPSVSSRVENIGCYRNIPVKVAVGDNQASVKGSIGIEERSILLNVGTGSQISVIVKEYIEIPGIEIRPYLDDKYLLVGAALCGGKSYAILEKFLREWAVISGAPDEKQYDFMLQVGWQAYKNKCESPLKVQTTFQGTREKPSLAGSILQIREENFTPGNLILGFIEGMIDELYEMYDKMIQSAEFQGIILVGSGNGMRRNPLMQEIAKEKFGMNLGLPSCTEEAAFGAAICARDE